MPLIRIRNGKQKGRVFAVRDKKIVIGRDTGCGIQILDQGVSREHAEIFRIGEMVFIRDLGSRNGSFVNEERIQEELLREGDVMRVGATQLRFESSDAEPVKDLEYDDNEQPFRTSLDLSPDDLYVLDSNFTGRENDLFKAICRAAQVVQGERDERRLYDRLLDLILEYIPADHLYLFLRDDATGAIIPRAMRQKAEQKGVPISRSILRRVMSDNRAILTADAMQDERFKADASIVMNQIRAVMCVPISLQGASAGAIYCVNTSLTDTFEQSDVQLISAMGIQLALAMDNLGVIRQRRRMFLHTIGRLVSLAEGVPQGQRGHSERVANFCTAIANELGLPDRDVLFAAVAGLLHDLGKVPAVAGLSARNAENSTGVAHVLAGLDFLRDIPNIQDALPAIRAHHERFDGSGIPDGLSGEAIPAGARIVAVASDFDKLIYGERPRTPLAEPDAATLKRAFTALDQEAGKLYDPNVVRALIVAYRHGALKGLRPTDSAALPPARELVTDDVESPGTASPVPVPVPVPVNSPAVQMPSGETMRISSSRRKATQTQAVPRPGNPDTTARDDTGK